MPQCDYSINTQNELMHHIETIHQQPKFKCDKCPKMFTNSAWLAIQIVQHHSRNPQYQRNTLNTGVWKCYFCDITFSGNEARDNHICAEQPYQTVLQQRKWQGKSVVKCTRGPKCRFLKLSKCYYSHAHDVEITSQSQGSYRSTSKKNMWCAFQDKCTRRQTCAYKHIDVERDFVENLIRGTVF